MKKHLALPVVLTLALIPSFGSQPQSSHSSQFHVLARSPHAAATFAKLVHPNQSAPVAHALPHHRAHTRFARPKSLANGSTVTVGFVSAPEIPAGGETQQDTFQADVNGDGKKDLVSMVRNIVSNNNVYSISVALGNGDGTFQAPVLTTLPNNDPILVGDVNGDVKADVIQVHPGSSSTFDVWISDSNADAMFTHASQGATFAVSSSGLQGGILIDLNGDAKLDVLAVDTANPGLVWTLLGNGDGTFQNPTSTALAGFAPDLLTFADFNGDGKIDFAGLNYTSEQVDVYLQSSSGFTFTQAGSSLTTPNAAYGTCNLTSGDLTADGKAEIVSSNCNDDNITVYVNNGDGTFQTGVYYASAAAPGSTSAHVYPEAATIADVNGDGKADILVSNDDGSDVTVLLGNGDGTVTVPTVGYAVGGYPRDPVLVGDFNGDGLQDVIVSDREFGYAFLKGYGDGTFRSALNYYAAGVGYGITIASGDFNGDTIPDFVVGNCCDSNIGISVFLSRADGSLQPGVNYGAGGNLENVVVADFNGDTHLDIAATARNSGVVDIFTGVGDGTFTLGSTTFPTDSTENSPTGISAGDFNHDGFLDLAVVNQGSNTVGILLGDGAGNFSAPTNYPLSQNAYDLVAADVNADGYLDLIVPLDSNPSNGVAVFLGKTDNSGTFNAESDVAAGFNSSFSPAVGDLNNDGKADLVFTVDDGSVATGVAVAMGNGDGTFQPAALWPSSLQDSTLDQTYPSFVKIFDLNTDGKPDLIVSNSEYGTVATLFGNGDGTFAAPLEYASGGYAFGLALADVNGDGAMDAITAGDDFLGATVLLNSSGSGTQPDFKVAPDVTTATVSAGSPATFNLTVTGANGYSGTVTFACSGLPSGATCSFSPATIQANNSVPLATVLTLTTSRKRTVSSAQPGHPDSAGSSFWLSLSGLGIFGMFLAGSGTKRARRHTGIVLGVVLLGMVFALVGCADDHTVGTPPGTFTVMVTATGTGSTTPTHLTNLTLVVQ